MSKARWWTASRRTLRVCRTLSNVLATARTTILFISIPGSTATRRCSFCCRTEEKERKDILKAQGEIYERDYLQSVKPFDGVRDVFRALIERGGRIALATDCKGAAFKHYLSVLKVDDLITVTACGDDVEHGKPDPRLVGMALRKLGLPGSQSVMIGDTPYDAEAGLEAGTKAAGVLTGGFSAQVLSEAGCFAVAEDLKALLPRIEEGEAKIDAKVPVKRPSIYPRLRSA